MRQRLIWLGVSFLLVSLGIVFWAYYSKESVPSQESTTTYEAQLRETYLATAAEYRFNWTFDDYRRLQELKTTKEDHFERLVSLYGKPSTIIAGPDKGWVRVIYDGPVLDDPLKEARVTLDFYRLDDRFVLYEVNFLHLPLPDTVSVPSNPQGTVFTPEFLADLVEGTEGDTVGEGLTTILETYTVPDQITLSVSSQDPVPKLETHYYGISSRSGNVRLTFVQDVQGEWRLVNKYSTFRLAD